jgi:hypothetical protein
MEGAIRAALAVGLLLFVSQGPAGAQPAGPMPRVGYLGFPVEPEASPFRDAFMRGLRGAGCALKGATPAELPFEEVTKLELVVNLKTAKALGLAIPNPFLLRVDRVIE